MILEECLQILKKIKISKKMTGNKTMFMILKNNRVFKTNSWIWQKCPRNFRKYWKTQKNCKFVVDEICFKSLKMCRAMASSLPWNLLCQLHCNHVDITCVRVLSHTYLARVYFFIPGFCKFLPSFCHAPPLPHRTFLGRPVGRDAPVFSISSFVFTFLFFSYYRW